MNIVAGACLAIGLRYAGTADRKAYRTLVCIQPQDIILYISVYYMVSDDPIVDGLYEILPSQNG